MNRDEKIEFHRQICEIEKAVRDMNGPYMQTGQMLVMLSTLREAWLDDEILATCEGCMEPILVSDEDCHMADDGCWVCGACIERWNSEDAA